MKTIRPNQQSHRRPILLDFSQRTKSASRLREGLALKFSGELVDAGESVTILVPSESETYHEIRSSTLPNVDVAGVRLDSDLVLEEFVIPRFAARLQSRSIFTFREGLRPVVGVDIHLHLHEDPRARRAIEDLGASRRLSPKRKILRRRSDLAFERLLRNVGSLSLSSQSTLDSLQNLRYLLRPSCGDPAVVHLSGWPDGSTNGKSEAPRDIDVFALVSADPRDDFRWLVECCRAAVRASERRLRFYFAGSASKSAEFAPALQNLEGAVELGGWVSDSQLKELMYRSKCFIHQSAFEGFGISLVEAMQVGTLPVANLGTAVAEIVPDTAFGSAASAGLFISQIIDDDRKMAELASDALARGSAFSWANTARLLAQISTQSSGEVVRP